MRHQVYRFSKAASLTNVRDHGVQREFIRVTGGTGGSLSHLEAFALGWTESPWNATGIKFQDGGTDWTVSDCIMKGFRTHPKEGKTYVQGDGYATEHPNRNISFVRCHALDCGDGGFDLKGGDWRIDDCHAVGNGKNYRFWSGGKATRIESNAPKICHLHICVSAGHKDQQVIEIDELHAEGNKPLLYVETKGSIAPRIIIKELTAKGISEFVKFEGTRPVISWP